MQLLKIILCTLILIDVQAVNYKCNDGFVVDLACNFDDDQIVSKYFTRKTEDGFQFLRIVNGKEECATLFITDRWIGNLSATDTENQYILKMINQYEDECTFNFVSYEAPILLNRFCVSPDLYRKFEPEGLSDRFPDANACLETEDYRKEKAMLKIWRNFLSGELKTMSGAFSSTVLPTMSLIRADCGNPLRAIDANPFTYLYVFSERGEKYHLVGNGCNFIQVKEDDLSNFLNDE